MAYQKPMVQVYQEYATTSGSSATASLPACIIGPCYHIIDADSDEVLAHAEKDYTSAGLIEVDFQNNKPGALIDKDSVVFRLANAYVNILSGVNLTGGTVSFSSNVISGLSKDELKKLAVGDYVYFTPKTTNNLTYRVMDVDVTAGTILINRIVPTNSTVVSFRRLVQDIKFKVGDQDGILVDISAKSPTFSLNNLTTEINKVKCTIEEATLYVGYKSLRQDLSSLMTINTVDEIEGKLGKISPQNPLAYGVMVALSNTTTSVYCIGVDSDDLVGYTAVKDKLENVDPLYSMVPLTMSVEVLTMFKNSAVQMSDPEYDMWRVAIGCTQMLTEETITSGFGKCSTDSNGNSILFTVTGGVVSPATGLEERVELKTSSVDAGHILVITAVNGQEVRDAKGNLYEYTIGTVVSEDMLTVVPGTPFATTFLTGTPEVSFYIKRTLDKTDQAKSIAAVSKAFGSSRFIHVWPDICYIDDVELPGYYLCCAIAGGIAGLPSQYGFTNLSMSGIGAVKHSNDYFSQEQLNIIAGGGTFIFVQATDASAPFVRHQLTTDISTTEFSELSFVKNYDYVSYVCRDVLQPFIGTWNVNTAALAAIGTALSAALETLKLASQSKIGAPILKYTIESISQLEDNRTRVEAYVNVTFPYPLNVIGLHLVSQ